MRFGGSPMTIFRTIIAPCVSECKADAGCPPLLIKETVGPTNRTNFERKKKNGGLNALKGNRTRTLAGILADIGSFRAVSRRSVPARRIR
jgi:hypothetical protein